MRDLFRSLRVRLVLLLLLVFLPAAAMVAVTHNQQRQFVTAEMETTVRRITGLVIDKEDAVIGGAQALVMAIAHSGYVARRDKKGCRKWAETLVREQSVYFNLGYVDENGNLACSAVPAPESLNFADRQWFRGARDSGAFTTGEYVLFRLTGEPAITYGYPITGDDGRFRGVAYAATTLAWLAHMVTTAELPPKATATVVDVQGNVLARYPDPEGLTGKRMPRTAVIALLGERPDARVMKATGFDGLERIYSLAPLKVANRDVYLLIGLPFEALYGSINRALRTNLIWLALLASLAIAAVWIGVDRLLVGRIRRLADASSRIAAGELSIRPAGQEDGIQELDQLARAFDQMSEGLEKREAERELAGRALRESEARLHDMVHLSLDPIYIHQDWKFVFANAAAARIFRVKVPEDLIGREILDLVEPASREDARARTAKVYENKVTLPRAELGLLTVDGEIVRVESHVTPFVWKGRPAAQVMARDISPRIRAEQARREVELALRQSEERFRTFMDNSPAVSWIVDAQSRIAYSSSSFKTLIGRPGEPLGGKSIFEIFPEDFAREFERNNREVLKTMQVIRTQEEAPRPDGSIGTFMVYKFPLKQQGQEVSVGGVAIDITEKTRAEHTVQESQAQLRGIIDSAMDAIITIDEDQCVVQFNPAAEVMFQCPVDDAVGTLIERFIPARLRGGHSEHVRKFGEALVTNRRMGALGRVSGLRADGTEFPVEASISRVSVLGHHYYTVIMRDVTERESAEEELRRSEASLANAQKLAKLGSWELDLQTNKLHWSRQVFEIFGIEESASGANYEVFFECVHPADRPGLEEAQRAALAGEAPLDLEHRIVLPDGSVKVVHERGNLERDTEGNPVQLVGTVLDVTERKAAQDRISQLNASLEQRVIERTAQLEAANQELQAFSYSVSHDLRAPLRGIDGWSQALLEDYAAQLDQRGREYLDRVRSETQRMGRLIDDLLGLSRVTQSDMHLANVDLSAMALALLTEMREHEPARQVECVIEPGIVMRGDAGLLRAALANLLENAWKFTGRREQARIEFGRTSLNEELVLFMRDNGVGFDPTYAKKLFAPFQRMHKASEYPGTGIGLATVARIVTRHGGRIWAESAPDRGATFFFTIPPAGEPQE